ASRRKPIRILIALGSPGDSGPLTADRAIAAGDGCVAPRQAMGLAAVTLYWDFMIDHRPLQSLGKHRKTIRLERSRTLRGVLAEVELSRLNVPFVIEGDELAVPAGFDAFLVPDPSLPVRVVLLQPVPHVELTGVLVPDLLDALEISPRAILVAM